jgi:TIR domain
MTMPARPVVFCSHASAEKPRVQAFAARLHADGIEAWVDKWEIDSGEDLVARINDERPTVPPGCRMSEPGSPAPGSPAATARRSLVYGR